MRVYVSPTGSATAAGTEADPTNLATAITKVTAGGTIYLRGGTYSAVHHADHRGR